MSNFDEHLDPYEVPIVDPSAHEIAQFACGFADDGEEERVLDAMLVSPDLRNTVVEARRTAHRFSQIPLAAIEPLSEIETAIRDSLRERAEAICGVCVQPRPDPAPNRWKILIEAFSQAASGMLGLPSFATHRSGHPDLHALAAGVTGTIETVTGDDNRTEAIVRLEGDLDAISDRPLTLVLIDPVCGAVPLAEISTPQGLWKVDLGPFHLASGLRLGLTLDRPQPEPRSYIAAAPIGNSSRVVPVEFLSVPEVRDGHLRVDIGLTAPVRAEFANSSLYLSLFLGGLSQQLGNWRIREWNSESRTLEIPVPATVDGVFQCGSMLRTHIA